MTTNNAHILRQRCREENIEAVKNILAEGQHGLVNESNIFGLTPLYIASSKGNLEIAKVLTASGALVNQATKDGETPLYIASSKGHLEMVKVLIASRGVVDQGDKYGRTPLYIASREGHLEIFKTLVANKANFLYKNKRGLTPLDVAKTDEMKQFIMNHPWYRRRPLLVTRPHDDHETNEEHQLTPLGQIVTVNKGDNPNSQDNLLFQIKIKVASFL